MSNDINNENNKKSFNMESILKNKTFKNSIFAIIGVSILGGGLCISGANNAKNLALNHAGILKSDIPFIKWSFDFDDFVATYDVEWYYNNMEYEYTIHATSGQIIKYEVGK